MPIDDKLINAAGLKAAYDALDDKIDGLTPADIGAVAKTGDTMTGALTISDTTASTSSSTGALRVTGGAGIGGNVNVGGELSVGNAAGTRANLGITPANIGALPDTTTAADIGASATFILTADYTTAATIYSVLSTMARGSVATIVTRTAASNAMCGVNYDMYGTIWRNPASTNNNYYLSMTRTSGLEQYCYVLTLTNSSMSHNEVYKYTGTAI